MRTIPECPSCPDAEMLYTKLQVEGEEIPCWQCLGCNRLWQVEPFTRAEDLAEEEE